MIIDSHWTNLNNAGGGANTSGLFFFRCIHISRQAGHTTMPGSSDSIGKTIHTQGSHAGLHAPGLLIHNDKEK